MNSNVHTIRLNTNYENMLRELVDYYNKEMSKTGLTTTVNESMVIKNAIERDFNRVRKLEKANNQKTE